MKKTMLMLLAGSLLVFGSCKKTGPQGPPGQNGLDGNANVKGTAPFDVNSWTLDGNAYAASFTDADITNDVADRGVVELFLSYGDGVWRNLPEILDGTEFYFTFYSGGFDIYYTNVDGTTPVFPSGTWRFRAVVIAPSQKQAHPNTNWKNYNEAMAALNGTGSASATQ